MEGDHGLRLGSTWDCWREGAQPLGFSSHLGNAACFCAPECSWCEV